MKKIRNKMLVIFVLFIQLSIWCKPAFAISTGDTKNVYCTKKITEVVTNYYGKDIVPYYTIYQENEVEYPVYCVNYEYAGVTDTRSYDVTVMGDYITSSAYGDKIGVWRAIINGYPFKTAEELNCANDYEAYAATKQAVFSMIYDRDLKWYTYQGEEGQRVDAAMRTIVNAARSSTQTDLEISMSLSEDEWRYDEETKSIAKKFNINCSVPIYKYSVEFGENSPANTSVKKLNKNEFEVYIQLENLTENGTLEIKVNANVPGTAMLYGKAPLSNLQNYVLTTGQDEIITKTVEYPENPTKLTIQKTDIEGNNLEGVKFNILDENKRILYEGVRTNEDGKIELVHLAPGTYYIQETETLEGYDLNTELVEIKVDFYEQQKTIVINDKIPEEPVVPDEPEQPEEPPIPETPPPELPKLPRTGF